MSDLNFDTAINVFCDASLTLVNGHYTTCAGYVIVYNDKIIETNHKVIYDSTNNYAEIYALKMAISAAVRKVYEIKYSSRINIFSDSQISVFGLRDWIFSWYKKLNKDNNMISDKNVEIANQDIFNQIVNIIVDNGVPIHIYHQIGHTNCNNMKDIQKVKIAFSRANKEEIDDDTAYKISYYNYFVDKLTRDNLMSIINSLAFDINNYQKDIILARRILDDSSMQQYGKLIYRAM